MFVFVPSPNDFVLCVMGCVSRADHHSMCRGHGQQPGLLCCGNSSRWMLLFISTSAPSHWGNMEWTQCVPSICIAVSLRNRSCWGMKSHHEIPAQSWKPWRRHLGVFSSWSSGNSGRNMTVYFSEPFGRATTHSSRAQSYFRWYCHNGLA